MIFRSTRNIFRLKNFPANAKIHKIRNMRGPVSPSNETRVDLSEVVNCFPEYQVRLLFQECFSNLIIHEIREVRGIIFLTVEAEGGKSVASRFEIDI